MTARCPARHTEHGLTLAQLRDHCLMDSYPRAEETLRRVLREEVERGTVDFHSTSRRGRAERAPAARRVAALRALDIPEPEPPRTRNRRPAMREVSPAEETSVESERAQVKAVLRRPQGAGAFAATFSE